MKERPKFNLSLNTWCKQFSKYRYVLLVIGVGVLLLLIPTSREKENRSSDVSGTAEEFSIDAMENRLEQILSQIEGTGHVDVMLTVESGMKQIFAQDGRKEHRSELSCEEWETVVVSSGAGAQEAVLVQQIYPQFQGALIVAEGGDNPAVRLNLTEAVSALTGLGADKISVCKGK